jgi:hypothetical protein
MSAPTESTTRAGTPPSNDGSTQPPPVANNETAAERFRAARIAHWDEVARTTDASPR